MGLAILGKNNLGLRFGDFTSFSSSPVTDEVAELLSFYRLSGDRLKLSSVCSLYIST